LDLSASNGSIDTPHGALERSFLSWPVHRHGIVRSYSQWAKKGQKEKKEKKKENQTKKVIPANEIPLAPWQQLSLWSAHLLHQWAVVENLFGLMPGFSPSSITLQVTLPEAFDRAVAPLHH
jgi:hypothetical protein